MGRPRSAVGHHTVDGGVNIQNYGSKKYIAARNNTIAGADRIGTSDTPTVLTINYTGDQQPSQSGLYGQVSMYRINSPSSNNQQIRARGFADDWLWGSGTFDRADMVFTFVEIDASLVKSSSTSSSTLESARNWPRAHRPMSRWATLSEAFTD